MTSISTMITGISANFQPLRRTTPASASGETTPTTTSAPSDISGAARTSSALLSSATQSAVISAVADFEDGAAGYLARSSISQDRRQQVLDASADFQKLLQRAADQNADADPKAFLKSLSPAELKVLQDIHGLGTPIDPSGLSVEGAGNLLVSPDKIRDIDHDGFEMVGAAKLWKFPPSNAPDGVKKAWAETTAGMSERDRMLLETSFMPITVAADGQPGGNSAYIGPDADYAALVRKALDAAEYAKKFDQSWQVETRSKQIAALGKFLENLRADAAG